MRKRDYTILWKRLPLPVILMLDLILDDIMREETVGLIEHRRKHWIIAANHVNDTSIQLLKESYAAGKVSKEDFAEALRAHQGAVAATTRVHRGF
eukprot:scaffold2462_cov120-Skeletonema_dohrnii-CCMP3373.AAC.7